MIVYKYGALKPQVIGGTFEDLLNYQRDSNAFYNALIEIERWRIAARDLTEELQQAPLDEDQKTEHRLAYNAATRAAGKATTIGWGQKQAVTERVAAAMKTRRKDEFKARARAVKNNYPFVKRILTCARPRHRRFDGEGILAATVQSCSEVTVRDVLAGTPSALKISAATAGPGPVSRRSGKRRVVTLRLRDGLSLEVPIEYSRELPLFVETAEGIRPTRVIFARLMIERIGERWVYSVHFTLDASARARVQTGIGKCAINFGWRRVEGGIRVAYAVDDQGNESSLVIPDRLIGRQKHAESLRSLADEVAAIYLGDGARRTKSRRLALASPDANHRALGRERFTHEQAAERSAEAAEHWARRDRKLYQWERNEYAATLRARREIYRLWARVIGAKYDSCVIEAFDMKSVIERVPGKDDIPAARHYRFLVAPHALRQEIKSVFGAACETLKPAKRTLTCHACGALCKWDKARELRHDCESCGAAWDQDANNSKNQLLDAAE